MSDDEAANQKRRGAEALAAAMVGKHGAGRHRGRDAGRGGAGKRGNGTMGRNKQPSSATRLKGYGL